MRERLVCATIFTQWELCVAGLPYCRAVVCAARAREELHGSS